MDRILTWFLNNPKLFAVAAGLVVSLIEVWRQRSKGKRTRDTLDLTVDYLREQGYTEGNVIDMAEEALQDRSRKKAAIVRELTNTGIRLDTAATRRWLDEEAAKLKGK